MARDTWQQRWRRWRGALRRMPEHPERVARGFAVGVFIGMLPGTGLLAALAIAFFFRLHKPSVAVGALVNNPWTTPFLYIASYRVGKWLTGYASPFVWQGWSSLRNPALWPEVLRVIWPTAFGLLILGGALAVLGYVAVYVLLRYTRRPSKRPS